MRNFSLCFGLVLVLIIVAGAATVCAEPAAVSQGTSKDISAQAKGWSKPKITTVTDKTGDRTTITQRFESRDLVKDITVDIVGVVPDKQAPEQGTREVLPGIPAQMIPVYAKPLTVTAADSPYADLAKATAAMAQTPESFDFLGDYREVRPAGLGDLKTTFGQPRTWERSGKDSAGNDIKQRKDALGNVFVEAKAGKPNNGFTYSAQWQDGVKVSEKTKYTFSRDGQEYSYEVTSPLGSEGKSIIAIRSGGVEDTTELLNGKFIKRNVSFSTSSSYYEFNDRGQSVLRRSEYKEHALVDADGNVISWELKKAGNNTEEEAYYIGNKLRAATVKKFDPESNLLIESLSFNEGEQNR